MNIYRKEISCFRFIRNQDEGDSPKKMQGHRCLSQSDCIYVLRYDFDQSE